MKKILFLTALIMFSGFSLGFSQDAGITVEVLEGGSFPTSNVLFKSEQIVIALNYKSTYDCEIFPQNAFLLYTTDGVDIGTVTATWQNPSGFPAPETDILEPIYLTPDSVIICINGFDNPWVTPWEGTPFHLEFQITPHPFDCSSILILDTISYSGCDWNWATQNCTPAQGDIQPDWGGPYMYYLFSRNQETPVFDTPTDIIFTGSHCDTFSFIFSAHDPDGSDPIRFSCSHGEIDEYSGEWTWVPGDISYVDETVFLTFEAMDEDCNVTNLNLRAQISGNYPPDFYYGCHTTHAVTIGEPTHIHFGANENCENDPIVFYVDSAGSTGDFSFADSILTYTPDQSAQLPATWKIGVTDTKDSACCCIIQLYDAVNCCIGVRGNVNCSEVEEPDVTDVVRLIDYLYLSHDPLCCPTEADCNGSGGEPDVSDIVELINHLYLDHRDLASCQ